MFAFLKARFLDQVGKKDGGIGDSYCEVQIAETAGDCKTEQKVKDAEKLTSQQGGSCFEETSALSLSV